MSTIYWKSGTYGNWSDAGNWIGGVAPVSTSDVAISAQSEVAPKSWTGS